MASTTKLNFFYDIMIRKRDTGKKKWLFTARMILGIGIYDFPVSKIFKLIFIQVP